MQIQIQIQRHFLKSCFFSYCTFTHIIYQFSHTHPHPLSLSLSKFELRRESRVSIMLCSSPSPLLEAPRARFAPFPPCFNFFPPFDYQFLFLYAHAWNFDYYYSYFVNFTVSASSSFSVHAKLRIDNWCWGAWACLLAMVMILVLWLYLFGHWQGWNIQFELLTSELVCSCVLKEEFISSVYWILLYCCWL